MKALALPSAEDVEQTSTKPSKSEDDTFGYILKNKKLFLMAGAIVLLGIAAVVYLMGKNGKVSNKKAGIFRK